MKRHLLSALVAAMALAGGSLALAQSGSNSTTGSSGSPATPPTHPTERSAPATGVPGGTAGGGMQEGSSAGMPGQDKSAEALQACKNLGSVLERRQCMERVQRSSKPGAGAPTGAMDPSGGTSSGTGTSGTGSGSSGSSTPTTGR